MKSLEAAGVPENEINQMSHENAMRHFRFDPFAHRPKESCTVGALRAEAADVDVAPKSAGKLRSEHKTKATDLIGVRRF
jgi:hypothetical protein